MEAALYLYLIWKVPSRRAQVQQIGPGEHMAGDPRFLHLFVYPTKVFTRMWLVPETIPGSLSYLLAKPQSEAEAE